MRKLVLVLIAFIAVVTFVRELGGPQIATESIQAQTVGPLAAEPISVLEGL